MKLRTTCAATVLLAILALVLMRAHLKHGEAPGSRGANAETTGTVVADADALPLEQEPGPQDRSSPPVSTAASSGAASSPSGQAQQEESTPPEPAPAVRTNLPLPRFVGGHRANVPPGGALVVGGWLQPDGNRLLMFASPQPESEGKTVTIASRFISIPPSRLAGGGWERFMKDDAVTSEGGVYSADEYKEMVKTIAGFKDVDILSAPTVTTLPGQTATIEIMREYYEMIEGSLVLQPDGLSQSIIARPVEGGSDIDLAVTAAQFVSGAKDP